jgi:hypothetical protein
MLFVVKGFLPMKTIESIWLQTLAYRLCPRVVFPCKKVFVKEILPTLVPKNNGDKCEACIA